MDSLRQQMEGEASTNSINISTGININTGSRTQRNGMGGSLGSSSIVSGAY
jgi:hypothetical protein